MVNPVRKEHFPISPIEYTEGRLLYTLYLLPLFTECIYYTTASAFIH